MLIGLIFYFENDNLPSDKTFPCSKSLYLLFSPRLSIIVGSCFSVLSLSFFWYVFKMFFAVSIC